MPAGRWLGIALAMLLPLSGCGEWIPHWRAFEVTVDLTVDGERMQITRRIRCEGEVRRHAFFGSTYIIWRATTRSFGERLPSGGAVMVVTPALCRSAFRKEGTDSDELPVIREHVPLIGWTDDAARPHIVEAYIAKEYFERPDARVRYHGMSARIIDTDLAKGGSVDDFGWFGSGKLSIGHYGFYAVRIPKEEWQEFGDVARHVGGLTTLGLLPQPLSLMLESKYWVPFNHARARNGEGLGTTPSPDLAWSVTRLTVQQALNLASIYPLFKSFEGFEIRPSEQSYLVAYESRVPDPKTWMDSTITLVSSGDKVTFRSPFVIPAAVYDPKTETILIIGAIAVGFREVAE